MKGHWHLLENNILYRLEGGKWRPISGRVIASYPRNYSNAGTKYLAFSRSFFAVEKIANPLSVKKMTERRWRYLGRRNFSGSAMFPAIFADNGVPYVVYNTFPRPGSGKPFQLEVRRYFRGAWRMFGRPVKIIKSFIETPTLHFSAGKAYLACPVGRDRRMGVFMLQGRRRTLVGDFVSEGKSQYAYLFTGTRGKLHVIFRDWAAGMKSSLYRYERGRWKLLGRRGFSLDGKSTTEVRAVTAADGSIYAVFLGNKRRMGVMRLEQSPGW